MADLTCMDGREVIFTFWSLARWPAARQYQGARHQPPTRRRPEFKSRRATMAWRQYTPPGRGLPVSIHPSSPRAI